MVRFQKLNLGPCHEIHAFPLILKSELSGQELEQLELIRNDSGTASNDVGIDSGCDSGTLGSRLIFLYPETPPRLAFRDFSPPKKTHKAESGEVLVRRLMLHYRGTFRRAFPDQALFCLSHVPALNEFSDKSFKTGTAWLCGMQGCTSETGY